MVTLLKNMIFYEWIFYSIKNNLNHFYELKNCIQNYCQNKFIKYFKINDKENKISIYCLKK